MKTFGKSWFGKSPSVPSTHISRNISIEIYVSVQIRIYICSKSSVLPTSTIIGAKEESINDPGSTITEVRKIPRFAKTPRDLPK